MRRLRIVLISGLRIFPIQSGGHLRTGGIAKALARLGHRVTLYSLAARRGDYGYGPRLLRQDIETGLSELVYRGWLIGLLQACYRRLGLPRIWQFLLLQWGVIPKSLRTAIAEADVLICDLPYSPPVAGFPLKPWFLLSHNLEHRLLEQGSWRERLFAPWMERVESLAAQRYAGIIACAAEDKDFFATAAMDSGALVVQVGNGVDPQVYQAAAGQREQYRQGLDLHADDWLIVFAASRYQPNLEALTRLKAFCRQEAQFLAENRLHFLVLGNVEPASFRQGALIATGPVADVAPYFAAADAAINPVTRGSGSNLKMFEYLAAQLPILSSSFGLRGLHLRPDRDVLVFSMDDLKERLLDLLHRHSRSSWRAFAADVWSRNREHCELQHLVQKALCHCPPFSLTSAESDLLNLDRELDAP